MIRFGSVEVSALAPPASTLKSNVAAGRTALQRATARIATAGISLAVAKAVPMYRADPKNPAVLLRSLNGKVSKGQFVNGQFKVLPKK
jgi:hypothetical protein